MIRNISLRTTQQWGRIQNGTGFSKVMKRSQSMSIHEVPFPAPDDGPLKGVRVLDLTRILAGPYCTMILGDLGAEIIKVERPGHGDDTRTWSPPNVADMSCYFVSVNRNKKSIVLDLKRGGHILKDLVQQSDVLVENYVPGTLEKLGLGYDDLREVNPRLIYCSITGFGVDGPYARRGGYDVIAASIGGLIHITGPQDGEPCKVGVAMTDLATGLYAHGAILAALLQRSKTNQGQRISCDLLSTQIATLVNIGSNYINSGKEATRWGTAHETIVPYEAFQTKDNRWITIGTGNNELYDSLCKALNLPELQTDNDERYSTNEKRVKNRLPLLEKIRARMMEKSCDEWLEMFSKQKFPYGPINDMEHAFSDPQVQHNKMVQSIGPYRFVGPPVTYSDITNMPRRPPPLLGEHTRSILQNLLKLSNDEIDILYSQKIVH